jgi:DNA-cytosine methyltransferase
MSVWENLKHLKGLNVVNLFAGMEVGRLACERAGVPIDKYYSSEIDKYAIQVSKANWPDIIHLGDVTKVYGCTLPDIHLLLGGSPCQGFSFAGKQLNFNDPRSALLFEYVRILKELREFNPDIYFLLENVMMKKEYQDVISELLGVQPVMVNSALVSAQNRKRLYWTNIPFLGQPADKGIVLKDILETSGTGFVINRSERSERSEKATCIDANYHKGADNHGQRTMIGVTVMENGNVRPYKNDGRKGSLSEIGTISHENNKSCTHTAANTPKIIIANVNPSGRGQSGQVYNIEGKSPALTTNKGEGEGKSPALTTNKGEGSKIGCYQVGLADDIKGFDANRRIYSQDGKAPTLISSTGGHKAPKVEIPQELYLTEEEVKAFARRGRIDENGDYGVNYEIRTDEKANAMTVSNYKDTGIIQAVRIVGRKINPETNKRDDYNTNLIAEQRLEINSDPGKTNCLTTVDKDNVIAFSEEIILSEKEVQRGIYQAQGKVWKSGNKMGNMDFPNNPNKKAKTLCTVNTKGGRETNHVLENGLMYRKLTVTECERLQTVPDGYTQRLSATAKQISNTQAYKMLGNGWTADVIAHLLGPLGDYRFLY